MYTFCRISTFGSAFTVVCACACVCVCVCSRERKKTPFLGKHVKKVTGAVWNREGLLAMAGADRVVSTHTHSAQD